jgi:hypothetical protein
VAVLRMGCFLVDSTVLLVDLWADEETRSADCMVCAFQFIV